LRTLANNLSVRAPQSQQGDLRKTERAREPHWAGLPVRFWRVGALVFQPDPLRIGHKVCHSEEWRRIVVWAARVPDLLAVGRTSAAKPIATLIRRTGSDGFFALQGMPAGMAKSGCGSARPAVYPASVALRLHPCRAVSSAEANSRCSISAVCATDQHNNQLI